MADNNTQDILIKLTEVDARCKSNTHRLDEVEKKQADNDKLLTSIALIAQRQDTIDNDIKEIKSDVKNLTSKSAKRWESVVDKIILAVVAALVAYVCTRIGLG
jgi:predicted  nucleic acid-binding Zn-ribbon protein